MASNTIEITAALSPEYKAAFASAIDIVKRTEKEMKASSKELDSLTKMQAAHAKVQEATAEGNAKAAEKAQATYDKLADKLKMTGASIETVESRMTELRKSNERAAKTFEAFAKKAQMQKVVKDLDNARKAAQKFKDPAIQAEFLRQAKAAKALGIEVKTSSGAMDKLKLHAGKMGPALRKGFAIGAKGAALLAGGAAMAGKALFSMTNQYIDDTANLSKTAKQYEINTSSLQEMRYAFGLAHVEASEFDSGLASLREKQDEAIEGNKEAQAAFKKLGISMQDLKNINVEELLMRTSAGLTALGDDASIAKLEKTLFGGQGSAFGLVLKDFDGVIAGRDEAIAKGVVLNADQIRAAEEAAKERFRLEQEMRANMQKIAQEIAPVIGEVMGELNKFLRENPELMTGVAKSVGTVVGHVFTVAQGVKRLVSKFTGQDDAEGEEARAKMLAAQVEATKSSVESERVRQRYLAEALATVRAGGRVEDTEGLQLALGMDTKVALPAAFRGMTKAENEKYRPQYLEMLAMERERQALAAAGLAGGGFTGAAKQAAQMSELQQALSKQIEQDQREGRAQTVTQNINIDARGAAVGEGSRIAQGVQAPFREAVKEANKENERLNLGQ